MSEGEIPDLVILCGGRGVRLRPMTDSVPKALVEVAGRPIIDHVLDTYLAQKIKRVFFCTGYMSNAIETHINGRNLNLDYVFSDAGEGASMLERLHILREELGERFIVAYCDTFIDLDVADMVAAHTSSGRPATMMTAHVQSPFGIVELANDGRVISFVEKPVSNYFVGCFIMERSVLTTLDKALVAMPDGSGIVSLFRELVRDGTLNSYQNDGLKISFNTHSEREEADAALSRYFTLNEQASP